MTAVMIEVDMFNIFEKINFKIMSYPFKKRLYFSS